MKRAFTLIELLVVIAIIAILAAILFPVFAQAKSAAKQVSRLSGMKQSGTATSVYLTDSDDVFPITYASNSSSTRQPAYWWNYSATFPSGWATTGAYLEHEDVVQFANSTYPYVKNYEMYQQPGGYEYKYSFTPKPGRRAEKINGTVNGLLNEWNMSAVAAPSRLPVLWQSWGDTNDVGMAWTNPRLVCNNPGQPCRFNAGGMPQGNTGTVGSQYVYDSVPVWSFKQGSIFTFADTSAKFVPFGRGNGSVNSVAPFRNLDARGVFILGTSSLVTYASNGSTTQYHANFRPDNEFNN